MVVGVLRLELMLEGVRTLKEKRSRVHKILARIRGTYPVSAAEVGHHELYQRARLGVCMVSNDEGLIHSLFQRMEDDLSCSGLLVLLDTDIELLHYGEK